MQTGGKFNALVGLLKAPRYLPPISWIMPSILRAQGLWWRLSAHLPPYIVRGE